MGDTWEWDGTGWSNITPASTSPSARFFHEMVFAPDGGGSILFGGWTGRNETWLWDGHDWQRLAVPTQPPARVRFAMAYDSDRQRVVLFGGDSSNADTADVLADTWELTGTR